MPRESRFLDKISRVINYSFDSDSTEDNFECEFENHRASTPVENFTPSFAEPNTLICETDLVDEENVNITKSMDCSSSSFENSCIRDETIVPLWSFGGANSTISEQDLVIILLAMQSYFRLPDTAMDGYCALLSSLLPPGHRAPSSFRQVIRSASTEFTDFDGQLHFVCSGKECDTRFSKAFDACTNSKCNNFRRIHQGSAYIKYKIRPQLENLIRRYFPEIQRELDKSTTVSSSCVSDVTSSRSYTIGTLNLSGDRQSEIHLNLILSSDGAQPFKAGGSNLWPCVAVLCELPPKIRSEAANCIVLGFWIGNQAKKKPTWPLFLESSIAELNSLNHGFNISVGERPIRVRARIFCTIFDLPAQASIWSHKQFNGINGCISCYSRAQRQNGTMIWPNSPTQRSKSNHFFQVAWARLELCPSVDYRGVTGISPLSKILNPADVNCFDPMHMVYRGNADLIFSRFFQNKPGKWVALFAPRELRELSDDLRLVQFPAEFTRTIPNLEQLATFKASEMKNLLLYAFLPASAPYLTELPDYWHWAAVYVHAIRLLSQPTVSEDDVQLARVLIGAWQRLIPELLHELAQNYNAHGVQHLPSQVLKFGPLWATSAFCFESFNGEFVRRITSAKGPAHQIARRFVLQRYAALKTAEFERTRPPVAAIIRKITHKTALDTTVTNAIRLGQPVINSKVRTGDIMNAIHKHFGHASTEMEVKFSDIAFLDGQRLHSNLKARSTTRPRSTMFKYIELADIVPSLEYASARVFVEVQSRIYAVAEKYRVISRSNILSVPPPTKHELVSLYLERLYGDFYVVVSLESELIVIPLEDIITKVVVVPYNNDFIVTDILPYEHN